ncbi:MAG TPA: hypothetical protein VHO24_05500 [Opitutaceae bacterium]|nr:hypothetical protein [Opitutaceae bacterium]
MDPAELAANAAALEAERRRLDEDADALRLREANLREYEAHLRALQSEMDALRGGQPHTGTPFPSRSLPPFAHDDASLEAAWQKLHRARELSEAEQAHLRDDRLTMHAFEVELKQREAAVAAREARVAEQEELLAAAPRTKREPMAGQQTISAFTRLTRAPFLIAESLRGKNREETKTGE